MSGHTSDTASARGFPPFPAGRRGGRRFAQSWWGNAWIKALEDTSLDNMQLRRGRRYAHAGHVDTITVSPGRIGAAVYDDVDDTSYRTVVQVEQLDERGWSRFLDQVAARAGHIAALLDKDMPRELVEAADDVGVRLLPGIGDLEPECTCPGWELPCRHAAALCYQASWLLDEDPFVLLLLRGRDAPGLMADLHDLQQRGPSGTTAPDRGDTPANATASATGPASRRPPRHGTPAEQAYAEPVAPLPAPPPLPPLTQPPADWPSLSVEAAPGVDPAALDLLATDTALRARELLTAAATAPSPALDERQDAVRIAATHPDPQWAARLAETNGRSAKEWAHAVEAWRCGGRDALEALESAWSPPPAPLARARAAFTAVWEEHAPGTPLELRIWRNRCTVGELGLQLRYGRNALWYPYRDRGGDWWPAGAPHADPGTALAVLLDG